MRLTPAYSVKVVQNLLDRLDNPQRILAPFSGSGTTGLVCAERGINCDLMELNPFLAWLAAAKTHSYNSTELEAATKLVKTVAKKARQNPFAVNVWIPPLNRIDRWWHPERLITLANLFNGLDFYRKKVGDTPSFKLAAIAFCQVAINWSNAAFNHQSMSFKDAQPLLFQAQQIIAAAKIFYIVGNSKFYDTLVPVEKIYVNLFKQRGFNNVKSEVLRKRNSKKELYEYIISARWK